MYAPGGSGLSYVSEPRFLKKSCSRLKSLKFIFPLGSWNGGGGRRTTLARVLGQSGQGLAQQPSGDGPIGQGGRHVREVHADDLYVFHRQAALVQRGLQPELRGRTEGV